MKAKLFKKEPQLSLPLVSIWKSDETGKLSVNIAFEHLNYSVIEEINVDDWTDEELSEFGTGTCIFEKRMSKSQVKRLRKLIKKIT